MPLRQQSGGEFSISGASASWSFPKRGLEGAEACGSLERSSATEVFKARSKFGASGRGFRFSTIIAESNRRVPRYPFAAASSRAAMMIQNAVGAWARASNT